VQKGGKEGKEKYASEIMGRMYLKNWVFTNGIDGDISIKTVLRSEELVGMYEKREKGPLRDRAADRDMLD